MNNTFDKESTTIFITLFISVTLIVCFCIHRTVSINEKIQNANITLKAIESGYVKISIIDDNGNVNIWEKKKNVQD